MKLKLQYKKTSELMFFANNSRLHDKEQIKQIADSIKEFEIGRASCRERV